MKPLFDFFDKHYEYRMFRRSLIQLIGKNDLIGCEIGVQTGKNALKILETLDIKKLYLVDPYLQYNGFEGDKQMLHNKLKQEAHKRLEHFDNRIVWIEKDSTDIKTLNDIKEPLDFVYIDGNHSYEWVKKDISNWYDKIKIGGLISGHDINHPDVFRALSEFTVSNDIKEVYIKRKDWWFIK